MKGRPPFRVRFYTCVAIKRGTKSQSSFLTFSIMATSSDQCVEVPLMRLISSSTKILMATLLNVSSDTTSTCLHPFFRGGPTQLLVKSRSLRVSCPSACTVNSNNLEASASTATRRRSATVTTSTEVSWRAARRPKLNGNDDEIEQDNKSDNGQLRG